MKLSFARVGFLLGHIIQTSHNENHKDNKPGNNEERKLTSRLCSKEEASSPKKKTFSCLPYLVFRVFALCWHVKYKI